MPERSLHGTPGSAEAICKALGLRYYPDSEAGISRRKCGTGFTYLGPDGARIGEGALRDRIKALAIPPAYSSVWISPHEDGYLTATGVDEAERKQYRYHPKWTEHQETRKYAYLPQLGERLPRLRSWVSRKLADGGTDHDTAIAAALCLMERHSLRIGTRRYSRENGSFAATTLTRRHFEPNENAGVLSFTGKGGRAIEKRVRGRGLVARLSSGPKDADAVLIGWWDGPDTWRGVSPEAVRTRLVELLDLDVTPRILRTWNGSRAAFVAARAAEKPTIKSVAEAAARELHNTPSIARSSYIHPDIIEASRTRTELPNDDSDRNGLRVGEDGMMRFLSGG